MQPKNSIRRKPAFPDGMLIVLGVIILCVIVTWFIPSGQYDRILDASGRQIVDPNSFHYIESEKISLLRIPHFIVEGTIAQAEMIFFPVPAFAGAGIFFAYATFIPANDGHSRRFLVYCV